MHTGASLIDIVSKESYNKEALSFYLLHYLNFLSSAGHDIIYSIPEFDNNNLSLSLDFSSITTSITTVSEIRGVSVEKINSFFSTSWLQAAMLAGTESTATDIKASLAEYSSTSYPSWSGDFHFHVKLGAPRVEALCGQELVLYFMVDSLTVYESTDFTVYAISFVTKRWS